MRDFSDSQVIVVGGASGIGAAIVSAYETAGARVLSCDISHPVHSSQDVGSPGQRVTNLRLDVTNQRDLSLLATFCRDQWGPPNIAVNCALSIHEGTLEELSTDDFMQDLRVNVLGSFMFCKTVIPLMKPRGGNIVLFSSIDAFGANGHYSGYNASKAAILGLMRTIATEVGPANIRINAICPGFVATEGFFRTLSASQLSHVQSSFSRAALGRLITPEEVANACLYLSSDLASGITGTELTVDGGTLSNLYMFETLLDDSSPG